MALLRTVRALKETTPSLGRLFSTEAMAEATAPVKRGIAVGHGSVSSRTWPPSESVQAVGWITAAICSIIGVQYQQTASLRSDLDAEFRHFNTKFDARFARLDAKFDAKFDALYLALIGRALPSSVTPGSEPPASAAKK